MRIGPTGEPEAYAVVPSDIVAPGSERAIPGLIEGVAGGTNYGNIGVACSSPLNEFVENFAFASADDCWSSCAAAHGEALVAVTFYPADNGCYCQDDCTCLEACDDCELVARQGMQPPDNWKASCLVACSFCQSFWVLASEPCFLMTVVWF